MEDKMCPDEAICMWSNADQTALSEKVIVTNTAVLLMFSLNNL